MHARPPMRRRTPENGRFDYPASKSLSEPARDLPCRLCVVDRAARLADAEAIRAHAWLDAADLTAIEARTCTPPFMPNTKIANFDAHDDDIMSGLDADRKDRRPPLEPEEEARFEGFGWRHDRHETAAATETP